MKILVVGDSQTDGPPGQWLETTLRNAGHHVIRSGHSGHGAYDWTRLHWPEYRSLLSSLHPDHVIMVFGSNDVADARLEGAMRKFQAESAPAHVWYAGPPHYEDDETQQKGVQIRTLAKRVFGSAHLDAWPYTGPGVPRSGVNKVHFTSAGGRVWGEAIARNWTSALGVGKRHWIGPVLLGTGAIVGLGLLLLGRR